MNDKLRLVHSLLERRKARRKKGRFVVEGPHLVEEAGNRIDFVVYAENPPLARKLAGKGVKCYKVSREQFKEVSEVETPQWILAVVKERPFTLKDLIKGKNSLIVFCVEVQDPGNLGTIIRTADAVGAAGIVLSKGTADLYNAKVIRATMGSIFHLPIVQEEEVNKAMQTLKAKNIKIIAADLKAKKSYFEVELKGACAILIGNEGKGLDKDVIAMADETVCIPMPGKAESLNAGISSAVVLYEALRQRLKGKDAGKD